MGLKPKCNIEWCSGSCWAKGMCKNCYMRFWRNGTVELQNKPKPPMQRFWKYVQKTDSCWLWTAGLSPDGYGNFLYGGRAGKAHRFIYEEFKGPIPDGLEIDHLCRQRNCVNPAHLEAVTHAENVRRGSNATKPLCSNGHAFDMIKDGRRLCSICRRDKALFYYYENKERHREYQRRYQQKRRALDKNTEFD